jgi:hypothetical protein
VAARGEGAMAACSPGGAGRARHRTRRRQGGAAPARRRGVDHAKGEKESVGADAAARRRGAVAARQRGAMAARWRGAMAVDVVSGARLGR